MYVKVAIDLALDRLFTYSAAGEKAEKLRVGQLLRVSFNHRETSGFAMALSETCEGVDAAKVKEILGIADEHPFFSPALLDLVKWMARYWAAPIETTLHSAVPAAVLKPTMHPRENLFVEAVAEEKIPSGEAKLSKRSRELLADIRRVGGGWMRQVTTEFKTSPATLKNLAEKGFLTIAARERRRDPLAGRRVMRQGPLPLNTWQAKALHVITEMMPNEEGRYRPILLHGVTGSGKTEVYLQAIARELEAGRGAIVLVPEIALTPQTVQRFAARFGETVAVLHSALSEGERYDEWHRIRKGEARVVVGPRSAIFAPVENLGLIVVDEEHDGSYKQGETPRYQARDVAVMRAHIEHCRVVLGSATPSLETWLNAKRGKYVLAAIPVRAAQGTLPVVHLVNMDEEAGGGPIPVYSKFLLDAIGERLRRGEQTILFLNRRGYSRILECGTCHHVMTCEACDRAYTYHRADECLRCHICGSWLHVPQVCPACGARDFHYTGIGTQRAEGILKKCFSHARILRMDADATARKYSHDDILSAFRAHEADILLGTQMIAKGLDFPNVTLVGVLNADISLNMPDFRASERTYALLAQVSGRAGRAEKPGEVYIQTHQIDAPAIKASAEGCFADFADAELVTREEAFLPPYCRLAAIVLRGETLPQVEAWTNMYAQSLQKYAAKFNEKNHGSSDFPTWRLDISDAVPAELAKAEGNYRYQILMRATRAADIVAAWHWISAARPLPSSLRATFDMDAQDLL